MQSLTSLILYFVQDIVFYRSRSRHETMMEDNTHNICKKEAITEETAE